MYRVKILKNEHGRDFVCGDLHGCLERLTQFLKHVNFDFTKDRMFSCGDLVDRGPENIECLSLIREPWFKAVTGNHEQLMVDFYTGQPLGRYWSMNGGGWGTHFKNDPSDLAMEVKDLSAEAANLPLMMTVERQDGKFFHVIHAELYSNEPLTDADLDNEEIFNRIAFEQTMDGDMITWGRRIFYQLYSANLDSNTIAKFNRTAILHNIGPMFTDELSHIYCGHTVVQKPVRYKGQTNLDTCAYRSIWPKTTSPYGSQPDVPRWAGLTVTEPLTDKFWHCSEAGVKEIQPVILG